MSLFSSDPTTRGRAPVGALLIALSAAVAALAFTGCPGHLDDPERFRMALCGMPGQPVCTTTTSTMAPTTAEVQSAILVPKCGFGGCHAAQFPGGGLDLASPNLEARLVSVTSSTALCSGRVMVNPGAPNASLMWTKLSDPPPCPSP